jgi:hypothetical protein
MELKKPVEEVVKFNEGQKVYIPKNTFAFDVELIEVFNVFQDDGSNAVMLVDKLGQIFMKSRNVIFSDIELAKQYYLNWLAVMHDKLSESWKPAEKTEEPKTEVE